MCAVKTTLFSVAEKSNSAHDPVIWVTGGLEQQREDVGQVSAPRFLVDRTLVEAGGMTPVCSVDGVHMDHRQGGIEYLGRWLRQLGIATVPTRPVHEQTVDVHA